MTLSRAEILEQALRVPLHRVFRVLSHGQRLSVLAVILELQWEPRHPGCDWVRLPENWRQKGWRVLDKVRRVRHGGLPPLASEITREWGMLL
jgi:hypothetical protein